MDFKSFREFIYIIKLFDTVNLQPILRIYLLFSEPTPYIKMDIKLHKIFMLSNKVKLPAG